MKDKIIAAILRKMGNCLDTEQREQLEIVLVEELKDVDINKTSTEVGFVDDSLEKLKNMYLATLSVENKSPRTIEQYSIHLGQFTEYFRGKQIQEIDATDIRAFLFEYKRVRKISNRSLDNKRGVISSFFSWLLDEEYIEYDPTRKVKKIKTTKIRKKAFSAKELEKLKMQCENIRDRAIVEMLISTGCRVSELCSINLEDIDFNKQEITIVGKGDKERVVFISDTAMLYLELYLSTRESGDSALFVTKRRPFLRLQKDGVERMVRNLGRKCNVEAYPHKFRRTLCTMLINRGMPAQDVAVILGHEDVNVTCSVYYSASTDHIHSLYEKYAA